MNRRPALALGFALAAGALGAQSSSPLCQSGVPCFAQALVEGLATASQAYASPELTGAWDYTMEWEPFVSDATFTCRGSGIWELVDDAGSITGEGGGRKRCTTAENPTWSLDQRELFRVVQGHVDGTDLFFLMDQLIPDGTPQNTYCYRWGNCSCQFQGTFSASVAEGRFSCFARGGESRGTWSARLRPAQPLPPPTPALTAQRQRLSARMSVPGL
jgi:hypothetical protein